MKNRTRLISLALLVSTTALTAPYAYAGDQKAEGEGWMVRGRVLHVVPDEGGTTTIGGHPEIDNSIVPELDISYFFNKNVAVELILGTTPHDAELRGSALGDVDLGDVWLLPPTLVAQYHFDEQDGFKPYVGAGVNYTIFYNADAPGGTVTQIDYDDNFGFALQAGVDIHWKDNWYFNVDVKKVFLETDVSVNNGAVTGTVDIDPWLFGVGVAYRY